MRYYSETLNKFYDTEEQCLAEEEKARVDAEKKKVTKAKLAKVVEDADKALDAAYENLEKAKASVAELQKEYDAKVDNIMNPAVELVKKCSKDRADAIKEFNDNFGVYTTTYSGDKALNELVKMDKIFDNFFKKLYF
jgi:hypothetical protein